MPVDFELGFKHTGLLAHAFERIFVNISTNLKLPIVGIYLDITSEIYHLKIGSNNHIYKNTMVFKINDNIIIPNQDNIIIIINKNKIKRRTKIN